jgi:class 3 adenylate cyclase
VENLLFGLQLISTSMTIEAIKLNATWPFVTVPLFEVMGELTRQKTGLEIVIMAPWVTASDATRWEQYSQQNFQWWRSQSQGIAVSSDAGLVPTDYQDGGIIPFIFEVPDDNIAYETGNITIAQSRMVNPQGPYMPIWQMTPPPFNPQSINFNLIRLYDRLIHRISDSFRFREAVFSPIERFDRLGGSAVKLSDHEAFHASLVKYKQDQHNSTYSHPHCSVVQPIFEQIHNDSSAIVGFLIGILPWDRYLVNLLPEGVRGITCILRNTCGQAYTYELDGNSAYYIGEGDMHNPTYDFTEMIIPFHQVKDNGLDEFSTTCQYSFYVYASEDLENVYMTPLPAVLASSVAVAFIFMMFTFFTYDRFVRQRTNKIVGAAARSGAIVSSLFPSNVRDRLYAEHTEASTQSRIKSFINTNQSEFDCCDGMADDDGFMYKSKPIADIFPNVTVVFADIVGFTSWSATRDPTQVFILLETLYKSFDAIAIRLGVYKVETIGDCYVAAAGIPEPRANHAVIMARFARACMHQVHITVQRLVDVLGSDTTNLSLRIGLHSGPVTAGVLRGERSRFQLFGDTMNTASRIETTGSCGKIHASQETADLLIAGGKSQWVSARADKVVAKGKGEMQTYWVSQKHTRSKFDGSAISQPSS